MENERSLNIKTFISDLNLNLKQKEVPYYLFTYLDFEIINDLSVFFSINKKRLQKR